MEDDKREYLRSVKDLQERLEHALENLDGCPQLILHYEPRKLYDGLCVRNLGVSAASKVRLQQVESGNLLLTSDELSLVAGGPNCGPDGLVPLRLNANPKDPRQRTYHDTEAFEAFIDDREAPRLPSVTELNPVTEEMLNECVRTSDISVTLTITYFDSAGKGYTSPNEIVWNTIARTIIDIKPGRITKNSP